jgi:hypothetical protein
LRSSVSGSPYLFGGCDLSQKSYLKAPTAVVIDSELPILLATINEYNAKVISYIIRHQSISKDGMYAQKSSISRGRWYPKSHPKKSWQEHVFYHKIHEKHNKLSGKKTRPCPLNPPKLRLQPSYLRSPTTRLPDQIIDFVSGILKTKSTTDIM